MIYILILFIFASTVFNIEKTECICLSGWMQSTTGQCYKYYSNRDLYWPNASLYCHQAFGANLPIFRNLPEQLAYNDLMNSTNIPGNEIHYIGLWHDLSTSAWMWVDNTSLTYNDWYGGGPSGNGDCSYMMGLSLTNKWNDYNCFIESFSFSCQMNNITCPPGWMLSETYQCYYFITAFEVYFDWISAENSCQSYQGHLPIFRTDAELKAFNKMMIDNSYSNTLKTLLGLYKVNGQWMWADNTIATYFYWGSLTAVEPNNDGNCTSMFGWQVNNSWADLPCDTQFSQIFCQLYPSAVYIPINVTAPAINVTSSGFVCPTNWIASSTGQCYLCIDNADSSYRWNDALTYCRSYGATLPIFRSMDEQLAYNDLITSVGTVTGAQMLGLYLYNNLTLPPTWLWADNTTTNFYHWDTGSPSGDGFCTYMNGLVSNNDWNDYPCTQYNSAAFCCQMFAATVPSVLTNANISLDFLQDPMSLSSTIQDVGPFLIASLNSSMKQQLGQQFSDLVPICTYENKDCSNKSNFQYLYNPTYGNCYTFNAGDSPIYSIKDVGPDYDDYSCTSQNAGFRVTFHENDLPVYPETEGYNIPPGTASAITLDQSTITRLGNPYGKCSKSRDTNSEVKYTIEDCLRKCFQNYLIKQCHCSDPRFPLTSNDTICQLNKKNCLDYVNVCSFDEATTKCDCPPPCSEVLFSPTVTFVTLQSTDVYKKSFCNGAANVSHCENSFQQNFAILYIYYRSLKSFEYCEIPNYNIMRLLSDFSGVTGLLLGVCVMTIPEVAFFLFSISTMCFAKSK